MKSNTKVRKSLLWKPPTQTSRKRLSNSRKRNKDLSLRMEGTISHGGSLMTQASSLQSVPKRDTLIKQDNKYLPATVVGQTNSF
jgi:hypothetical protein